MNLQLLRNKSCAFASAVLLLAPITAHAEMFPEGILGMKLGQTRVEALTALVDSGAVPDLERAQCTDKVPEKNKSVANRICKLSIQPGSSYQGLGLEKVTFLLQDESIVLIGLYVNSPTGSFTTLRSTYQTLWGAPSKEATGAAATWKESGAADIGSYSQLQLYADTTNAFVVYSFANVQ